MLFSNQTSTLLTVAEAYFYLGWSVIPLHGDRDSSRPKVPTIPWAIYQQYRASVHDQQQWTTFGGLGIVTGRVSQLVVLDFDDEEVFKRFRVHYPDLVETHTVRSAGRQLPHLYFKLPSHLHIASQKGQGIDLLSDGRYVVAPPTTINGQDYKITRGGMPKTLTERDIRRLQAFLSTCTTDHTKTTAKVLKNALPSVPTPCNPIRVTTQDLIRLYQHHCQYGGRNEALFRASLFARDTGWSQAEALNSLMQLHVQQTRDHERPAQRQREALATIRSAFSRPARQVQAPVHRQSGLLSNSVREALMQRKMTYVVRVIEGLSQEGSVSGVQVTAKEGVAKLKGLVGRDSIWNALKAKIGKKPIFTPVSPRYAVATDKRQIESKNAFFEGSKNQEKVQRGRPQQHYRIPTNDELCNLLGVEVTSSDALQREDLGSARKTRMALHSELIKRRPGQYPRRWLAQRLGVNTRTLAAYNRLIPIHSKEMHIETTVTWKNIQQLPFDEPIQGAVLVTLKGKRYPALRMIASRLLAMGQGITLKQQTVNYYWYGEQEPLIEVLAVKQEMAERQEKIEQFMVRQPVEVTRVIATPTVEQGRTLKKKTVCTANCNKPLKNADQEALAQHLYQTLNTTGDKVFSLKNSRRMVIDYSRESLIQALTHLQKRQYITYPVGFLITILRSNMKKSRILDFGSISLPSLAENVL